MRELEDLRREVDEVREHVKALEQMLGVFGDSPPYSLSTLAESIGRELAWRL